MAERLFHAGWRPIPKKPTPTHVYVMTAGTHLKIGLAEHVERRRLAIQASCPLEVSLAGSMLFVDFTAARFIEKELHAAFADRRGFGEWFDVPKEAAVQALLDYSEFEYIPPPPPVQPTPRPKGPLKRPAGITDGQWSLMKAMDQIDSITPA